MNVEDTEIERKLRDLGSKMRIAVRAGEPTGLNKIVNAAKEASRKQYIRDMHKRRNELLAEGNVIPDEIASLPPLPDEEEERKPKGD